MKEKDEETVGYISVDIYTYLPNEIALDWLFLSGIHRIIFLLLFSPILLFLLTIVVVFVLVFVLLSIPVDAVGHQLLEFAYHFGSSLYNDNIHLLVENDTSSQSH